MPSLVQVLVDLFNALAAAYTRRKYGAAARRLGRVPPLEDGRRGFIVLEIDGLAHIYLRQALKAGAMPTLARLVRRRRARLGRWRCGLPSTTPASQAGILYGNNWDIPGFRWYDKATDDPITCRSPLEVRALQDRISAGRAGLLRGGSSYTNMLDGDARLALFTLAAIGRDRLFENVRGLGFLLLFALSAVRLAKVILLSLWTWGVYVVKRAWSLVAPSRARFTLLGPLSQVLYNVVFREVTTFCVLVDIYRGMPAVYASYNGYDDIAHHFGVDSPEALRALRGLDAQIRQIDRLRRHAHRRPYDLFVLSDHGQTPSVPFRVAYGQTLHQFIAAHTGGQVRRGERAAATAEMAETPLRWLLDEIRGLEARPHRALAAQLLRAARRRIEARLETGAREPAWDLGRRSDVVVQDSGSLSHVYFNATEHPMDLSEVVALYPPLLEALLAQGGIGWVVGREGEEVVVAGRAGTLWIGPEGRRVVVEDPLACLPDPPWAAQQLARLARFPHSGDLILLGAWDGRQVVSFEDQISTHGGLGGPQTEPFIACSAREPLCADGIDGAHEIYERLVAEYGTAG